MKERLTTLALALGALALFYALFFRQQAPDGQGVELPLSTTASADGYLGLWQWLKSERIPVAVQRSPFDRLQGSADKRGDVLVVTMPPRVSISASEAADVQAWVARGNTLLVMAALDDTPTWSLGTDPSFLKTLQLMTGLDFTVTAPPRGASTAARPARAKQMVEEIQRALRPQRIALTPRGEQQPLFRDVHSVLAISENPASHWRAVSTDGSAVLEIAQRRRSENLPETEPAAWLKKHGEGQIIVFGLASIFSNGLLGEQDNARLFANLLAWTRAPAGLVIFDDGHQGAVDYYDTKAFFADPRLRRTILWVIVLWLLFVLGSLRMRPEADPWNPLEVTAFISATGDFFASTLKPATVAGRLFDNFFDSIRRRLGLIDGANAVWAAMAADARYSGPELVELKHLYVRTQARERVDLLRLQTLISRALGNTT